ncbi:hypothetical protein F2Q68_00027553 [Brassica cretica]|uniref:Uncharacterized protein n=1 Tax=Brassica cretica TaxID=69181 RepID=A0A8S9IIW2_BRACR|nr:hypothetical protein F2Q68_00027553 [Brassica cretica]
MIDFYNNTLHIFSSVLAADLPVEKRSDVVWGLQAERNSVDQSSQRLGMTYCTTLDDFNELNQNGAIRITALICP